MNSITFRATEAKPCPVCGTGSKGCSATDNGLHLCRGEPRDGWRKIGKEDLLGFGHYRRNDEPPAKPSKAKPNKPKPPPRNWHAEAKRFAANLKARPEIRARLATVLGLPVDALEGFTLGMAGADSANGVTFTIPERDGEGTIIGITTRIERKGKPPEKKTLTGSKRGLTVPDGWRDKPGPLLFVEGVTDAAALTAAGLCAIGRANFGHGAELLAELVATWSPERGIIVVGDNDANGAGLNGATSVSRKLSAMLGRPVPYAMPPDGSKDVRQWLTAEERGEMPWPERGMNLLCLLEESATNPPDNGKEYSAKQGAEKGKPDSPVERSPVVRCLADIEPRKVEWLWLNRIPIGRITTLAGDQGDGKSFSTADMAARVSTGRNFPDGAPCPFGSVLIVSAEDDPHDTIRPRLDVAEADVNKVHILEAVEYHTKGEKEERAFTLADMPMLEKSLGDIPDCKLIIIDPIGSYLGGATDANQDNKVRAVLAPVAALAAKYKLAVVVVAHTRKSDANSADDKVLGSRAFTALARAVWHVSIDPEDIGRRLFLPGKGNLSLKPEGLAYRIEDRHHAGLNAEIGCVVWEDAPVTMTADDAIFAKARNDAEKRKPGPKQDERQKAAQWLAEALEKGPQPPKELQTKAEDTGHKWRTVDRAAVDLGILRERAGFGGGMLWHLPTNRSDWEPALLVSFQEAEGELREFSELATALEAKAGKKPRNGEILAVLEEWMRKGILDRTGHGVKKDPYLYRLLGYDHSRQDDLVPAFQDPQQENNLATWQECENKPEMLESDPAPSIPAKMPSSPGPGEKAAKPKRERKAKPNAEAVIDRPADAMEDSDELPPAPPGKLFDDAPGLPD